MRITKYGHACLLVEINGIRIITDPGNWNPTPDAENVAAILVTHEHQDHCDIDQLKAILEKNPNARVITHEAVGAKLTEESIVHEVIGNGEVLDVKSISIESCGTEHSPIYGSTSPCRNTGYIVGGELFIPGDALHDVPGKSIRVLALPTGGPWMRPSEAIDYAKRVKPEIVFPIHDAVYIEEVQRGLVPRIVGGNLEPAGIKFIDMAPGDTQEF
jgi:L-ascorbate metabolism protein UlaG (beta-lactamase superfamily)